MRTSIRYGIAGGLIPGVLWGVIKSQDYGLVGGSFGETVDRWAFELLIMFAPFFYHIVAILQDQSLATAYAVAFGTNIALYAAIGILSKRLLRSPWAYYSLGGLIVASMLIGTDSWFLYRWLNREEFHLPLALGDFDLRYFLLAAGGVITLFFVSARKRT